MKSSKASTIISRLTVLSLSISLLCVQTGVAFTSSVKVATSAEIAVSGPSDGGKAFVMVNGERAFSGRTFISNGTIATTETSSATVSLGKLGRVELAPSSSLSLSFSENRIAGVLSNGSVSVSNTDGVSVTVGTPDDLVANEGNSASRFTVSFSGDGTGVVVSTGNVRSNKGAVTARHDDDDDDDDDDDVAWMLLAFGGGFLAGYIVATLVNDDDDEIVSPVR